MTRGREFSRWRGNVGWWLRWRRGLLGRVHLLVSLVSMREQKKKNKKKKKQKNKKKKKKKKTVSGGKGYVFMSLLKTLWLAGKNKSGERAYTVRSI